MKKILLLVIGIVLCVSLAGCSSDNVNNNGISDNSNSVQRQDNTGFIFIEGHPNLYYDPTTEIVYFIFRERQGYKGFGYMSVYYAPNGLPYKYDVDNKELVEIHIEEMD